MAAPVAFVLKGYPRLSETFIAQEIHALERLGLDIRIVSLRHPTDKHRHPIHQEITAPVTYLPEYLYQEPARVWRGWRTARRMPGYARARATWLRDLRRDPTPNRVRRFGQALVLAAELPEDVTRLHAHFLHTPASVTRYAATMRGLPWTCSAHAVDIWTTPDWEKREKLAELDWLVTCTGVNAEHLGAMAPDAERVELLYHGLDFSRFAAPDRPAQARDGTDAADPVRLVSVGRAVEKKGYEGLLDALAALPDGLNWRLTHVGGGPRLDALKQQAEARGISGRIEWKGALPQSDVLALYRDADLFVLACRIAANGDRDGLPNVLMEAQSQALPCLSTAVSAIPELIADGETGVLVPPDDADALAAALAALIGDPARRNELGRAGLHRVRARFSFEHGIARLGERFGLAVPQDSAGMPCASPSTPR